VGSAAALSPSVCDAHIGEVSEPVNVLARSSRIGQSPQLLWAGRPGRFGETHHCAGLAASCVTSAAKAAADFAVVYGTAEAVPLSKTSESCAWGVEV